MGDPNTTADTLARAREAYARSAWGEAYRQYAAVRVLAPLDLEDLDRLALAAGLIGHEEEGVELRALAHQEALTRGDLSRAAGHAFWAGFFLFSKGEFARGGGWLARAARLVDESAVPSVVEGFLQLPVGLRALDGGDTEAAFAAFDRAAQLATKFADRDLETLARLGRGVSLLRLGERARGFALLDEAMVAVTNSEVSPLVVGIVYCAVIEACNAMYDLARAQEWTAALTRWCEAQPDLVPFRGRCQLFRAQLMQLHGAWQDATEEVRLAHERLAKPPPEQAVGEASYRQAELSRLRGAFGDANAGYRDAAAQGRRPEPGLALLRLAQNQPDKAAASIRHALDDEATGGDRPTLLAAAVEILIAVGDVVGARAGADELSAIAEKFDAPLLLAMAGAAEGAVLLAEGKPSAALGVLRRASSAWRVLGAPYEVARVAVLAGLACRVGGDEQTATIEFDVARETYRRLGAAPDLVNLEALTPTAVRAAPGGLSARETEVLRLVVAGKTNRAIASDLVISEKTVARHLSNMFAKLDVSSRAAATAFAFEHGLVERAVGRNTHVPQSRTLRSSTDASPVRDR
jgi:DNA-binding CsgD family transcriptional regulator